MFSRAGVGDTPPMQFDRLQIINKEEASMSEEVQATQPAEGAAEGAPAAASKTKKINRMTATELSSKIEDLEKANQIGSKYYKQLLQRKKELGI